MAGPTLGRSLNLLIKIYIYIYMYLVLVVLFSEFTANLSEVS